MLPYFFVAMCVMLTKNSHIHFFFYKYFIFKMIWTENCHKITYRQISSYRSIMAQMMKDVKSMTILLRKNLSVLINKPYAVRYCANYNQYSFAQKHKQNLLKWNLVWTRNEFRDYLLFWEILFENWDCKSKVKTEA